MNKVYVILDKNNQVVVTKRVSWCYQSLGAAKTAAKLYIKHKNLRRSKTEKLHFEDFKIVEFELVEKTHHPI